MASADSGDGYINLKVVDSGGNEVVFRIRNTTPMRKLMNSYCERKGLDIKMVRFLIDGEFVKTEDTPKSLDLEDGEIIDVVLQQEGGF